MIKKCHTWLINQFNECACINLGRPLVKEDMTKSEVAILKDFKVGSEKTIAARLYVHRNDLTPIEVHFATNGTRQAISNIAGKEHIQLSAVGTTYYRVNYKKERSNDFIDAELPRFAAPEIARIIRPTWRGVFYRFGKMHWQNIQSIRPMVKSLFKSKSDLEI